MRYRLGQFVVDTSAYTLLHAGRQIAIRPKVFDLLCYLIEHRDRVVTKQELLEALWREQHVDEFAVPWTVSHTRRALGQETGTQHPIQTVRGRGYRFVGAVTELPAEVRASRAPDVERARPEPHPFVGREHLMAQLAARLSHAKGGSGAFCLLVGEAGIGKTRCMEELVARAEALDICVWTGRSVEATCGPVFWPWIQVLRALARDQPALAETAEEIVARLSAEPADAGTSRFAADAPALSVASGRFWQYDALARLLEAASRERAILIALDDLHWADAGTWELLDFIAPELRRLPILVLGARREERRAASRSPRAQARSAERFKLASFGASDVERYLELITGLSALDRALCEAIREVSAGNPWFLRETVDALLTEHGPEALVALPADTVRPAGAVMDRLRARLAALAPESLAVLQAASVLGERFDMDLVARMAELPIERALTALEEARAEDLVSIQPPGACFRHGLLRSVLYEDLATPARLGFHLAAARALEQTSDPLRYGEIAHHFHRALPLAESAPAAHAALRAADAAARARAFADAAAFLEWAAEAQQNDARVGPRERAVLALQRATMERLAGREPAAREGATRVFELAREHGYSDLAVQAARVLRATFALGCMPDPVARAALEDVLARSAAGPSAERASALSLLSWLPPYALDMQRSQALSAQALALARELADPAALNDALHARLYALSGPDDIDALLEIAQTMLALPGERPPWLVLEALLASYRAHLYRGDLTAAGAALDAFGREAGERGIPEATWHHDFFRAQRVFSTGDFDASEAQFAQLAARGARLQLPQAPLMSAVASSLLTHARDGYQALGHGATSDAMLTGLLALPSCYAATGARLAAELGRRELARKGLFQLTQRDFEPIVRDLGYVNVLTNLSVVSIVLDDREKARAIYERLAPYPHHNTPSGVVGFYEGSASRFLAGLAAYLGERTLAAGHFDDALALNDQLGARPQVAQTCYEYAGLLVQQNRKAAASALKRRAVELADALGMRALSAAARAL